MTGVVRPETGAAEIPEAVQLASGWILGAIGLIIVLFIIFFKRKMGRKPEIVRIVESISSSVVKDYLKSRERLIAALVRKDISESKIKECIDFIERNV